jgi:hypothetical protein
MGQFSDSFQRVGATLVNPTSVSYTPYGQQYTPSNTPSAFKGAGTAAGAATVPARLAANNPGNTGPQAPGALSGPGFGETYGQSSMGAYEQPSMLEQFAQQQMNGDNPYYQRLQQQQADAINQQMAARGHYNSGGALAALGNASAALNADQFANMGQLVGNASSMGLQRQQQGFQQAAGVQQLQQNRLQNQFGDAAQIAGLGAGLYGGFYGQGGAQSGDAGMAGINAGANAAGLTGQGQQAFSNTVFSGLRGFLGGGGGGPTNYGNGVMPLSF